MANEFFYFYSRDNERGIFWLLGETAYVLFTGMHCGEHEKKWGLEMQRVNRKLCRQEQR